MARDLTLTEVPAFITLDEGKDGQYMCCRRCCDFRYLPQSMSDDAWLRAVQDFAFTHDVCKKRSDLSV